MDQTQNPFVMMEITIQLKDGKKKARGNNLNY